jgi:hypothetical protein
MTTAKIINNSNKISVTVNGNEYSVTIEELRKVNDYGVNLVKGNGYEISKESFNKDCAHIVIRNGNLSAFEEYVVNISSEGVYVIVESLFKRDLPYSLKDVLSNIPVQNMTYDERRVEKFKLENLLAYGNLSKEDEDIAKKRFDELLRANDKELFPNKKFTSSGYCVPLFQL